jgi:hypothetical protein
MSFGNYIVYVDESGDHGLDKIDPEYPIFVLAFCIFKKMDYISDIVPAIQKFKFRYWGHDAVVIHEHEIRKSMAGDFRYYFTKILYQKRNPPWPWIENIPLKTKRPSIYQSVVPTGNSQSTFIMY